MPFFNAMGNFIYRAENFPDLNKNLWNRCKWLKKKKKKNHHRGPFIYLLFWTMPLWSSVKLINDGIPVLFVFLHSKFLKHDSLTFQQIHFFLNFQRIDRSLTKEPSDLQTRRQHSMARHSRGEGVVLECSPYSSRCARFINELCDGLVCCYFSRRYLFRSLINFFLEGRNKWKFWHERRGTKVSFNKNLSLYLR